MRTKSLLAIMTGGCRLGYHGYDVTTPLIDQSGQSSGSSAFALDGPGALEGEFEICSSPRKDIEVDAAISPRIISEISGANNQPECLLRMANSQTGAVMGNRKAATPRTKVLYPPDTRPPKSHWEYIGAISDDCQQDRKHKSLNESLLRVLEPPTPEHHHYQNGYTNDIAGSRTVQKRPNSLACDACRERKYAADNQVDCKFNLVGNSVGKNIVYMSMSPLSSQEDLQRESEKQSLEKTGTLSATSETVKTGAEISEITVKAATSREPPASPSSRQNVSPGERVSEFCTRTGHQAMSDLHIIVANFVQVRNCVFFAEGVTSQQARSLLQPCATGTFLLRDSSDPNFLFALSVRTGRGTTSVRVAYRDGYFYLDSDSKDFEKMARCASVISLLQSFMAGGDRSCVLVEGSGRQDLHLQLISPYRHSVGTLQHLSRVALNRVTGGRSAAVRSLNQQLPDKLQTYMTQYKHRI